MKFSLIKILIITAMSVAALFSLFSCDRDEEMGPDVLVVVDGDPIRSRDLQLSWAALPDEEKEKYIGPQGVKNLLDELITWKLMAQEAEKRRLHDDPDVKERLELFRQQIMVNALLQRAVSKADIFRHYQENFLRCRFIFLPFPEDASEKDKLKIKREAEDIHGQLKDGADFAELARTRSGAANAAEGGDMGYVTHSTLTNMAGFNAAEQVFALKEPGQFTGPLQAEMGYYVFQMIEPTGNLDPRGLTLELENALREVKREEVIRSFANELRSRPDNVNKIKMNERAIRKLMQNVRQAWEESQEETTTGSGSTVSPGGTGD